MSADPIAVGGHDCALANPARRKLLAHCAEACVLAAVAPLLSACASLATWNVRPIDGRLELALAQHPELSGPQGALRVLPSGHPDPIYVLAQRDGSFIALSPICTHRGCTVDVQGDRLICPCHGSTYDRTGRVLRGPAERALAQYPVQLTARGVLVIDLRTT
jgi:nitrite reductase/ring-hydroxylating ferredoxin subunit